MVLEEYMELNPNPLRINRTCNKNEKRRVILDPTLDSYRLTK